MSNDLDLDSVLSELYTWKSLLKRKNEEIKALQDQLDTREKRNKVLDETHSTLLKEVSELNKAVSLLHTSIGRLETKEVKLKSLTAEVKKLKAKLEEEKNCYEEKLKELERKAEEIVKSRDEEIKKGISMVKTTDSLQFERYTSKIRLQEEKIQTLEDTMLGLRTEKNQEILKIKIEYEEKIKKLNDNVSTSKDSNPPPNDFKTDVFRIKYVKLEKESKEEISRLKTQILELQSNLDAAKRQVLNSTRRPALNEVSNQNGGKHLPKKARMQDDWLQNDSFQLPFMARNNTSEPAVKPVKKKLFNLDNNYFHHDQSK